MNIPRNIPRIVIAGTQSGVGKTTVSLALMAGFRKAGCRVQAFKVGPDYIDPSYHELATGFPSHNLDTWMMGRDCVAQVFEKNTKNCDIAIIEGVMGLFDGASATTEEGSTAEIAKLLESPVILVVDAGRMARSAAAMVKGYQSFDPQLRIAGVIFNKIGGAGHYDILHEAMESSSNVPVLGALSRNPEIEIPERHLGLTTASENDAFRKCLGTLTRQSEMDLEKILEVSRSGPIKSSPKAFVGDPARGPRPASPARFAVASARRAGGLTHSGATKDVDFRWSLPSNGLIEGGNDTARIAIARDRAFSFYYQANLDFLEELGALLVPFSPLDDSNLPEGIGALYFGGGFPEVYAEQLEANPSMHTAIAGLIREGLPVYAECGGLMYLTEAIQQKDGIVRQMVGILPGKVRMTERLQNFGYAEAVLVQDCFLGKKGENFRAHEFHYSSWEPPADRTPHQIKGRWNHNSRKEGFVSSNVFATYLHCHFLSYPSRARAFVEAARRFLIKRKKVVVSS